MDIDYEEWFDTYKPKLNKHGEPQMFETYGEELESLMDIPETLIWTWVDGGDYSGYSAGFHRVNRMGYFVCEVPWEDSSLYVDNYVVTLCDMDEHVWVEHKRYDGTPVEICSECEIDRYDYVNGQ